MKNIISYNLTEKCLGQHLAQTRLSELWQGKYRSQQLWTAAYLNR